MLPKIVLCVLTVLLSSCNVALAECRMTGYSEERVCDVSFYKIISDAKYYEGKLVELRGYYSVHSVSGISKRFLFISKEAEFSADYGASVELGRLSIEIPSERTPIFEQLLNHSDRPLRIVGRLKLESRQLPNGRAVAGLIDPIVGVSQLVPPPRIRSKGTE